MVEIRIRKINSDETHLIQELAKDIWIPSFAPYFSANELEHLFDGMYSDKALKKWFDKPSHQMFIAEDDKGILGYFAYAEKDGMFWLDKIYVYQSMQGLGVGKNLATHIESIAVFKKYGSIKLRVNRRNELAILFYKKGGYTIESSVDFQGPNGFVYDDYIMKKRLI